MALVPAVLAVLSVASSAAPLPGERDLTNYSFQAYLSEFGKGYSPMEMLGRAKVFEHNFNLMVQHNADPTKTWFAAPNEFTDWPNEEFRILRTHGRHARDPPRSVLRTTTGFKDLPEVVDWRTKDGVLTPVKNQGSCGSCWAFSAAETLESALALATGEPAPVLSEQQIVSCSPNPKHCGGTGGCSGSTQPLAFNYTETVGLGLESTYPYKGETGTCQPNKVKPVAINSGYTVLPANDYSALASAVATVGPISISVAAGSLGWQMYGGGVFSGGFLGSCGYDVDHAVQLVGYGSEGSKDYWIVRNSWGGWGEHGYIRIERFGEGKEPCGMDKTPQDGDGCEGDKTPVQYCGFCAILSSSSYPTGVRKLGGPIVV